MVRISAAPASNGSQTNAAVCGPTRACGSALVAAVFLSFADGDAWMQETLAVAQQMLDSFEVPPVAAYSVSRRVNAPTDDDVFSERIAAPLT